MALPPELAGLAEVPADQRFSHFKSAQVHLTDRDGHPVTIEVTPGVATSVSPTNLTITSNDGPSKTLSINDQTIIRGKGNPAQDDRVVAVTLNGSSTAHAVVVLPADGTGPWAWHAGFGR
jgi:hypothetical protein